MSAPGACRVSEPEPSPPATEPPTCPRCGARFEDRTACFCPLDGARLVHADPRVGTVVAGDIVLTGLAGVGASGRVYRGWQRSVRRDVAVKILHPELSRRPESVARFEREARIASRLRHPHIVDVHLAGALDDGSLFIAMEYVDGVSLRDELDAAGGRLELGRALSVVLDACAACAEAHDHGVVHRDLKPENICLVRQGESADWVKILDFGIAKSSAPDEVGGTAAGLVFGTARYISPEAAAGSVATPASDVYALATILYEMLAGQTPFDADDGLVLLVKQVHEPPPELRSLPAAVDVPEPIARVVMANLAKEPAQRAPDARAFGAAVAAAAEAAGVQLPQRVSGVVRIAPAPRAPEGAARADHPPSSLPPRRSSRARVALAFVLGVLVAGGAELAARAQTAAHTELVARARDALAHGRYVSDRGSDDVRGVVATGLARWPGDPALLAIRSSASRELDTTALAKHAGGDVEGARDVVRRALELDPADRVARSLSAQYDREISAIEADPARAEGRPLVTFVVTKDVRAGGRVAMVAHVVPRSAGASARVENVSVTVSDAANPAARMVLSPAETEHDVFVAEAAPRAAGVLRVVFEGQVAGRPLYAERTVHVAP